MEDVGYFGYAWIMGNIWVRVPSGTSLIYLKEIHALGSRAPPPPMVSPPPWYPYGLALRCGQPSPHTLWYPTPALCGKR